MSDNELALTITSVRIDVRRSESLKNGSEVVGSHTKCKVVKNKVAPPFKVAEFDILYGSGISKSSEIIDMAIQLDIVEKSGAWFYYDGNRLGQGKDNVRKLIESDSELMDKLEALVREKAKSMLFDENGEIGGDDDDDFDIEDFGEED